jgi:amidase
VAAVVADSVRTFEDAGAHVEPVRLGISHDQRELSDLWCRLILPINVAGIEGLKAQGIDLMDDHPGDLPPEYRAWIERGYGLTALDIARDQVMRTEIFDALQAVLARYDLIVGPTLAALPVANATTATLWARAGRGHRRSTRSSAGARLT